MPTGESRYLDGKLFFMEDDGEWVEVKSIGEFFGDIYKETPPEIVALNEYLPSGKKLIEVGCDAMQYVKLLRNMMCGTGMQFGSGYVYYDPCGEIVAYMGDIIDEVFYMREDVVDGSNG